MKRLLSKLLLFLPALFWVLLIFSFDIPAVAILTLICAFIHECGHEICIYRKFGILKLPRAALHGIKISGGELLKLSYKEEALVYASGPLANLFAAAISLPFCKLFGEYLLCFIVINVTTALSNLIPIRGYDGYGVICAIVKEFTFRDTAIRVIDSISLAFTMALCLISLYLVDRFGESYWLYAVFIISLLSGISEALKNNINE